MDQRVKETLDFWFGDRDAEYYGSPREEWFKKDEGFDEDIKSQFAGFYEEAASGVLDDWREDPEGCLALIIVLDQFPRNMFRDDPKTYATDGYALELAKYAIAEGHDRALPEFQRPFVYMPYMHSEDIGDQNRCVTLFEAMGEGYETNLKFAHSHRDIVARFGRFPHRNEILGRENTRQEEEFLKESGSSF